MYLPQSYQFTVEFVGFEQFDSMFPLTWVKWPLHFSIKVTCSSVWLCCIGSLLPESCS